MEKNLEIARERLNIGLYNKYIYIYREGWLYWGYIGIVEKKMEAII